MSRADDEGARNSDDWDNIASINDVESLRKGIIKTSKNKANKPYTILLVGETGVGKSSVLEFIANILIGKDIGHYDFQILDHANEQSGSENQSQTNSARIYELRSKNGIVVRILDTPGLADTRGVQQDELHKRSIATQIQDHLDSVTAVLILANGTVPRVTVGTDYALSTLSAIFPKSLASNTAFMFTNVSSPLHWNFSGDTIPADLKNAPYFLLNNPVALQKKYLKLKDDPTMKKSKADLRKAVRASEQNAIGMVAELFDWLDGLEPQPTVGMLPLRGAPQTIEGTIPDAPGSTGQVVVREDRKPRQSDLTHNAANELPQSADDYALAWPLGGLSARVERAIRLLEQKRTDMEEKGVCREQLGSIQRSLVQMKGRLDLLRKVKETLWEGLRKVKQVFFRA